MRSFMTGSNYHGLVIQDRDRRLLSELSVMRVIDREQAKLAAGFGSTTRANARLLALTKAGLVRRFFVGTTAGGKKALYALSRHGAQLVQAPCRGPRRKRDEVLVADFFVQHQLAINELYCTVKHRPILLAGVAFLRWLAFYEPLDPGIAVIPDGFFEVSSLTQTLSAFLEVDLGHEGLTVWKSKVQGYLRYAVSGRFDNQFRQSRFRVLVVANSERRLESLRSATATVTDKLFWFSTFDSINRDGFWSSVWLRPKDDRRQSLL
jgi:hypothetical protein